MYLMYICNVSDTQIPRNATIMEGKVCTNLHQGWIVIQITTKI